MTQKYSIRQPRSEDLQGRYTVDELVSLAEDSQVNEETLYYNEQTEKWTPIGSNKELQQEVFYKKKKLNLDALSRLFLDFIKRDIWHNSALGGKSPRKRFYALLRILAIILNGLSSNRLLSRSAALSYYSLIGLGPMVVIVVMISGFILQRSDSDLAVNTLERVLLFIAPPVAELSKLEKGAPESPVSVPEETGPGETSPLAESPATPSEAAAAELIFNEELVSLINNFIQSAQSGTVGVIGALVLIFIGIQLFTSIESTFNEIWGVRRGRSWYQRVVFYWTFISLGAVLSFASVTVLSAATLIQFFNLLPLGIEASRLISWLGPVFSFLITMLLLCSFYRFIPNTTVKWKAALAGGFFVTLLLFLNNYLSFIYVHRVITQQSLYGSLGILTVLMIGLYVFWSFVLLGGQVTYSVQNVDALTHQKAWSNVSVHTRETLSLAAFLLISRHFQNCQPPYSTDELSSTIRAPSHILNACLSRLCDLGLINSITASKEEGENVIRYQPARPLNQITLGEFKRALENYGNNEGAELIYQVDPLIDYYRNKLKTLTSTELGQKSVESLLEESYKPELNKG